MVAAVLAIVALVSSATCGHVRFKGNRKEVGDRALFWVLLMHLLLHRYCVLFLYPGRNYLSEKRTCPKPCHVHCKHPWLIKSLMQEDFLRKKWGVHLSWGTQCLYHSVLFVSVSIITVFFQWNIGFVFPPHLLKWVRYFSKRQKVIE